MCKQEGKKLHLEIIKRVVEWYKNLVGSFILFFIIYILRNARQKAMS